MFEKAEKMFEKAEKSRSTWIAYETSSPILELVYEKEKTHSHFYEI